MYLAYDNVIFVLVPDCHFGFLWWFFLLYVLVFKIFVLLVPYVCFHISS